MACRCCLRLLSSRMDLTTDVAAAEPVDPVARWQQTQAPEDLNAALVSLAPRIDYHLRQYGLGDDNLARGQAKIYAARALKSFDPSRGAGFATWLDRNMMQLTRFKRTRATPVKVPERTQLDAMTIERAKTSFEEEYGREPELDELADQAGMSISRLDAVRKGFRKMAPESAFDGNVAGAITNDYLSEAMDIVWRESDKVDRRILEMKTGYGGKMEPMSPKDVAVALNMSPVDLSRRSKRIAAKLDEVMENLEA